MEKLDKLVANIQDLESFKGQYLRHTREQTVWKVIDVGRKGVTTFQVTHYGGETFGAETLITWRAVQAIYAIMVHAGEIDVKETH